VKLLLTCHAHVDRRRTRACGASPGAQVVALVRVELIHRRQDRLQLRDEQVSFEPVTVDRVIHDGDG
jgi:hypothetical protein